MPGHTMPNLIGSSMHQLSGMPSKPCQLSPGCSTQQAGSVASSSAGAWWKGIRLPVLGSRTSSAFQGAKNQSFLRQELLPDARHGQPAGDGLVDDVLGQRLPAGPSIIAAATSFEAISA